MKRRKIYRGLNLIVGFLIFSFLGFWFGVFHMKSMKVVGGKINLLNVDSFIPDDVINDFSLEYGVEVSKFTVNNQRKIKEKVYEDKGRYDVALVGMLTFDEMLRDGELEIINRGVFANIQNIDFRCIDESVDNEKKYGVPFSWGITGMIINTKYIPDRVNSLDVFLDPKYKWRIGMANTMEDVFGLISVYSGGEPSVNTFDKFNNVLNLLPLFEENVQLFAGQVDLLNYLVDEKIWLAYSYSSLESLAYEQNDNLKFVAPIDGGVRWLDYLVIPRATKNKDVAEAFIDYILRPDISARIVNDLGLLSCNKEAYKFIDSEYHEGGRFFPSEDVLRYYKLFKLDDSSQELLKQKDMVWQDLIKSKKIK